MNLLYPSSPLRNSQPDEQYASEVSAVRDAGFEVSLFSFEDFQNGQFRTRPILASTSEILYRGWMLSAEEYLRLEDAVSRSGACLATSAAAYLSNHHLPNWYPQLVDLTPDTRIFPIDCDLAAELRALNWTEFFIKDYVKSLKTSVGSRISKPEQAVALVADMRRFRGNIEGGFCVRQVEKFLPNTEHRFFVVDGVPYAPAGDVPVIVHECVKRRQSRFYSVDVVQRDDGEFRIVEVGDGQVSDLVGWEADKFAAMLKEHFQVPK